MSGKHAFARTQRATRKYVPLIASVTLAAVLVGAAVTAMSMGPARDVSANRAGTPTATGVPSGLPSRTAPDRVSRGEMRAMPSLSASASPSPSVRKATPTQPSSGGTVVTSGTCGASYYATGTTTANGEAFDPNAFTAASKTLAFNTRVQVTNTANGKSVTVRINDRGPFVAGRCLDLTRAAFAAIASLGAGVITVQYQVLG